VEQAMRRKRREISTNQWDKDVKFVEGCLEARDIVVKVKPEW
jgi:hypothetical protein